MPVSRDHLKRMVDRLVTLPAAEMGMFESPEDERKAVRRELGQTLEKFARTDAEVTWITDRLMDGARFRPTPAEVRSVGEQLPSHREAKQLPEGCPECKGQPWVFAGGGMKRCPCERGQRLATMDAARAVEDQHIHEGRRL